jgi:Skp family chaperone for outer membrane proteins
MGMTKEERNIRERDRLREKRGGLKRSISEQEKLAKTIAQNKKKREYNRDRQRKIRAEETRLVQQILS